MAAHLILEALLLTSSAYLLLLTCCRHKIVKEEKESRQELIVSNYTTVPLNTDNKSTPSALKVNQISKQDEWQAAEKAMKEE